MGGWLSGHSSGAAATRSSHVVVPLEATRSVAIGWCARFEGRRGFNNRDTGMKKLGSCVKKVAILHDTSPRTKNSKIRVQRTVSKQTLHTCSTDPSILTFSSHPRGICSFYRYTLRKVNTDSSILAFASRSPSKSVFSTLTHPGNTELRRVFRRQRPSVQDRVHVHPVEAAPVQAAAL